MGILRWALLVVAISSLLLFATCSRRASNVEPRRVTQSSVIPPQSSSIAIPVIARVADLEAVLNQRLPATFTIGEAQLAACASAGFAGRIGCQFTGTVSRGAIRVTGGDANTLTIAVPVAGIINANELRRFVGEAPVSANAEIEAVVRVGVVGDWQSDAAVSISYRWLLPPGFDVFGRRISAAAVADPIVTRLIARLEAEVPAYLQRLQPRARLADLWQQGFAVVPVNPHAPAVWLRVTPQALYFANYTVADGGLTLALGATAVTETFIGTKPAIPAATPLPLPAPIPPGGLSVFRAHVPIIADYAGLESFVETALKQVETPPMVVRGIGTVAADFDDVSIHATGDGRLAIGLSMSAGTQRQWLRPRGTVWLTAKLVLAPGTQRLEVRDVRATGSPDTASFRLLLSVAQSRVVRDQIGRALTQDFAAQSNAAVATAKATLADKRLGDFVLSVKIDTVTNGALVVGGEGIYVPVDAVGTAQLRFAPVAGTR